MRVREATFDDYEPIMAVRRRNNIGTWSPERWEHYSTDNPFRAGEAAVPFTWVLEDSKGDVMGTASNIAVAYQWNGRPLLAAVASAWAVDPEHRGGSILLTDRFFRQKNVDLLLDTTMVGESVPIFDAYKAQRIPRAACDRVLTWITHYSGFVASALRHKGLSRVNGLKYVAADALWGLDVLFRRNRYGRVGAVVRELDDFDERFDLFWSRLRQSKNRLMGVRSREALAWHFKYRLLEKRAKILALENGDDLDGYLVLVRLDRDDIGLRRFQVADFQILTETPEHVEALMAAALRLARREHVHVVEVTGLESFKRQVLERLAPHCRKLPVWCYMYKALNSELRTALARPETWDPSPFDGDATL